jgi:hypothetical protein
VGSDPEERAATLRELARLDPVKLGLEAVVEQIVQAAATGCGSTGGVGLLLLGSDGHLGYVVAAGRPRRSLAGTQVRLAEGPSVDAFLQAAPVSSSDLAAEPRWPRLSPAGAGGGHPGVAERAGAPTPRPHRRARLRPHRPAGVAAPRPGGRRRLRPAAHGDPAAGHRTAAGAALPGAAVRGTARHPDRAGAWRPHAARTARPDRCGRVATSTSPDRGPTDPNRRRTPPCPPPTLTHTQALPASP